MPGITWVACRALPALSVSGDLDTDQSGSASWPRCPADALIDPCQFPHEIKSSPNSQQSPALEADEGAGLAGHDKPELPRLWLGLPHDQQ